MEDKAKYKSQNNIDKIVADLGKVPPQAVEFESAILGAILIDKKILIEVINILKEDSFYNDSHQIIFNAIKLLHNTNKSVDLLTVTEQLRKTNELEIIGGAYYLTQLSANSSLPTNINDHIEIIRYKSLQRILIQKCTEIINDCYAYDCDIDNVLDKFESTADDINDFFSGNTELKTLKENISLSIERALKRKQEGVKIPGISTGSRNLDKLTGGWQDGDFILIVGRPSMGKTAEGLQFALKAAETQNVSYFSLEILKEKLSDRIITSYLNINPEFYKTGTFDNEYIDLMYESENDFSTYSLDIYDNIFELSKLKSICRAKKLKNKLDLVIVDRLGLIKPSDRYKGNRNNEIGEISRELKQLAIQLKIPVIALHQLNRNVESRAGNKPQMSDLRDSGNLEQDANLIIALYREDYYHKLERDYVRTNEIWNIVEKNSDGATGLVVLRHNEYINKFIDEDSTFEQESIKQGKMLF